MNSQEEAALRSLQECTGHQQVKTRIQVSVYNHFPIIRMRVWHKRRLVQCPNQVKMFLFHLKHIIYNIWQSVICSITQKWLFCDSLTFHTCSAIAWRCGCCRVPPSAGGSGCPYWSKDSSTSPFSHTFNQNLGLLLKVLLFRQPPAEWPLTQRPPIWWQWVRKLPTWRGMTH